MNGADGATGLPGADGNNGRNGDSVRIFSGALQINIEHFITFAIICNR